MSVSNIISEDSINAILEKIPTQFSTGNTLVSVKSLLTTITFAILGYWLFSISAWFAMPITWFFLGLVFTGLNSIGYECGRGTFSKYDVVNALVGNIVCWPLLLPYESWNLQMKEKLFDNRFQSLSNGNNWWLNSLFQLIKVNFNYQSLLSGKYKTQLIRSVVAQWAFNVLFFSLLYHFGGAWSIVKYWGLPWVTYHIWMSSFISNVYRVPFSDFESTGFVTLPKEYPIWLEYITHDINYVISATRTISSSVASIPNHNLKNYYNSLKTQLEFSEPEIKNKLALNFMYLSPVVSLYGLVYADFYTETIVLSVVLYCLGAIGVVMGYHRLFAHQSFKTSNTVKSILLFFASSTFLGSCVNWCRDHRNHHLFSKTQYDPFNIELGLRHAHLALFKKKGKDYMNEINHINVNDLLQDPVVSFQDRYYSTIAIISGIALPTLIAGLGWGDFMGGFFFASILRLVFNMHTGLAIHSLTHLFGRQKYTDNTYARDSLVLSLLTFGEGNQNFHHAHPTDYRNGHSKRDIDPVRYIIRTMKRFGLVTEVKEYELDTIRATKVKLEEKKLFSERDDLNWGTSMTELTKMSWEDVKDLCDAGYQLVIIENIVHDVTDFLSLHPGGEKYFHIYNGKDATSAFNGTIYEHSNGGRNVARTLRIGIIEDDNTHREE